MANAGIKTKTDGTAGVLTFGTQDVVEFDERGLKPLGNTEPCFRAYRNTAYASAPAVVIQFPCDAEVFDTTDSFAGGVYAPNIAGYYEITVAVQINESHNIRALIMKNGAVDCYGVVSPSSSHVTGLVYMNGTTDQVVSGISDTVGAFNITPGSAITYMSGFLVRRA